MSGGVLAYSISSGDRHMDMTHAHVGITYLVYEASGKVHEVTRFKLHLQHWLSNISFPEIAWGWVEHWGGDIAGVDITHHWKSEEGVQHHF